MWIETSGDDEGSGGRSDAWKALLCVHTQSAPARAQPLLLHFAASPHLPPPSPHFFFVFLLHLAEVLLILVFFLLLCVPWIFFFGVVSNSGHSILWSKDEAEEEEE
jgi:hypothetical protein